MAQSTDTSSSLLAMVDAGTDENGDIFLLSKNQRTKQGTLNIYRGNVLLKGGYIDQRGYIEAGKIALQTSGSDESAVMINHEGVSRAIGSISQKGQILLSGGPKGEVRVSGILDAGAKQMSMSGGEIHLLGQKVGLFDNALIDVSGENAGTVLLGGDKKGQNDQVQNAEFAYVSKEATIKADGGSKGNGGKIIVFAKNTTTVLGTISAKGGYQYGDGGFIETSGLKGFKIDKSPIYQQATGNLANG